MSGARRSWGAALQLPCTTSTTQLQLSNGFSCTCFHFEAATPSLCHSLLGLLVVASSLKKLSLFLQSRDFSKTGVNFNDGINKVTSTHSNALDEKGHLFAEFTPCQQSEFPAIVTIYLAPIFM